MEKPEKEKRNILLCDSITQGSVDRAINKIIEINEDDDKKSEIYKDWNRDPIMLFINSYGGCVYDGLALVDMIKQSRTPVHTIAVGACMSMGLWVWLSGKERLIGENATLMFHDICGMVFGKTEDLKQDLKEAQRLQEMLINAITCSSDVKKEILEDYIKRKADWFITSEEAIELKLAHKLYNGHKEALE